MTAGCALTGVGIAQTDGESETQTSVSRDSFTLLPGTDHETPVYETRADTDGPTVLVVGGIHGNEIAGFQAATRIADWEIDTGTLVTIPEANAVAIEDGTRTGTDDVDLNRMFPTSSEPGTELARAIWEVVLEYDPDIVIDLHESIGIYDNAPVDGVGQAIFHSPSGETSAGVDEAAAFVNENYVDDPSLAFQTGYFTGPDMEPNGLLVHKAQRETDANPFLVETLSTDVDLETRVKWHTALVRHLVDGELFLEAGEVSVDEDESDTDAEPDSDGEPDEGDPDDPEEGDGENVEEDVDDDDDHGEATEQGESEDEGYPEDRESDTAPPTARIRTIPAWVDPAALENDQEITLEADASTGDGLEYEWDVDGDGEFEKTGSCLTLSVSTCGEFPVVLCVTDDSGATATTELVLSTA